MYTHNYVHIPHIAAYTYIFHESGQKVELMLQKEHYIYLTVDKSTDNVETAKSDTKQSKWRYGSR